MEIQLQELIDQIKNDGVKAAEEKKSSTTNNAVKTNTVNKNKNVRDLADSTLQQVAEDTADVRQHLAKRELERREKLNKNKKEPKENKPNLLQKTGQKTKNFVKENSADIRDTYKEYFKYMM